MCYQVKCGTCGKTTWAGCGRHVASVYKQVPEGQHCHCRDWPGVAPSDSAAAQPSYSAPAGGGSASEADGSSKSTCHVL